MTIETLKKREQMIRAELMGSHSHSTVNGTKVHVWKRAGRFIARGRLQGRAFGETMGRNSAEAAARLRQILTDIDNGTYVLPCERNQRHLANPTPRSTFRQLVDAFLAEKRQLRGSQTAGDYLSRLSPVLNFAELQDNKKRWPLAADMDRDFVIKLKTHLIQCRTTRNGRPGGTAKLMSSRQIFNILQCMRTLLAWATNAAVRLLPADWRNPLSTDLIGNRPSKDPMREDKLPLDTRINLVRKMDRWQLLHLAQFTVLPMRPDEAIGLLVSDVNFDRSWLEFGYRLGDINFTKEATVFRLPFPEAIRPLLKACISDRREGPLLRSRRGMLPRGDGPTSLADLQQRYGELLQRNQGIVQAAHDRKELFRTLLRDLGGVSEDALNREFKRLLEGIGIANGATLYSLRSSVTTAMKNANLPHLEMRYLTSHSTNDILNVYATLDPVSAMQRYFETISPLLAAIEDRAREVGLVQDAVSVGDDMTMRLPEITI